MDFYTVLIFDPLTGGYPDGCSQSSNDELLLE
jgi:hypothetical protein